jgi:hypothetical protein
MIVSFDEVRRAAFRALDGGGAAPGIDDEVGWACAWLEACGYPGLKMLGEALDETPREARRPSLTLDAIGIDLGNLSCVFTAPTLVDLAKARGRVFLRNVRHGLYLLPFSVRADIGIGCPVDPAFAVGGVRERNPYAEKLAVAAQAGITADDTQWAKVCGYSRAILVPESDRSRLRGAGAGLTDND